jgi:hypothetical protein
MVATAGYGFIYYIIEKKYKEHSYQRTIPSHMQYQRFREEELRNLIQRKYNWS